MMTALLDLEYIDSSGQQRGDHEHKYVPSIVHVG